MYLLCKISVDKLKSTYEVNDMTLISIYYIDEPFLINKSYPSGGTSSLIHRGYINELVDLSEDKYFFFFQIELEVYEKGTNEICDWLMINTRTRKIKKILRNVL